MRSVAVVVSSAERSSAGSARQRSPSSTAAVVRPPWATVASFMGVLPRGGGGDGVAGLRYSEIFTTVENSQ
jgi:hypothetical protein